MDSIEQPVFDSLHGIGQEAPDTTADRAELIDAARKKKKRGATAQNGDSPTAENSPLHLADSATSILCSPQNYGLRVIIVSSVVFSLAVTVALILTIYLVPEEVSGNAAVVAGDRRCASVGVQALKDGGNAVDAAVATAFCLAVVEPQHSGIGGGGFAIVHDHKFDNSHGYDFRETAPASFKGDMLGDLDFESSVDSTGVPGLVKGLAVLHKDHGKLEWKDLVQPSVNLAQAGFHVSEELADSLKQLEQAEVSRFSDFLTSSGERKTVNDTVTQPSLARLLKAVRDDRDALYTGSRASLFVQEVNNMKGAVTAEDLKNYKVYKPDPLKIKLRDLTVLTLPAPASGPLLSLVLNMAQKVIAKKTSRKEVKPKTYHQLVETFKFAFGQYSLLGDPNVEKSVAENVEMLLSEALAAELVSKMTNESHPDPSFYGPSQPPSNKGTSHISVIDSSEVMVSMTLSTGSLFGNKMLLPDSGIFLNNNLGDFSPPSSPSSPSQDSNNNSPAAGKRPQSTMCPTIVYNKDHPCDQRLVVGAVHGPYVITGLAQVIINHILFGDKLSGALSAPRLHNQLYPNVTQYERDFPSEVVTDLKQRGQDMKQVEQVASQVTGIRKSNDDITLGIDPRSSSGEDHF